MTSHTLLDAARSAVINMAIDAYAATLPVGIEARIRIDGYRVVEMGRYVSWREARREQLEGERIVHHVQRFVEVRQSA